MKFKSSTAKILTGLIALLSLNSVHATKFQEHPGVNRMGHIDKLERLPGGSFQWIKADGKDFLVSENGRIAILGDFKVMDVWSKEKISRIEDAYKLNRLHIDKINLKIKDMTTIMMGKGHQEVTVFVDPLCTNCKPIYQQLPDLIDSYKVNLVVVPLLSKESALHAKQLNCLIKSSQSKKAYDALLKKDYSELTLDRCNTDAVRKTFLSAKVMGITSVPFIIAPNGETHKSGKIDLLEFIKTNEK